jgi:hypothetical protein
MKQPRKQPAQTLTVRQHKKTHMSIEVFRKFPTVEEATELTDLLKENNIPYLLEDSSNKSDVVGFTFQNTDLKVIVKARIEDFPKIESLIDKTITIKLDEVDKEHYLFDFTDEELTEIIMKPNDWSNYDYKVAELILNERGLTVSPQFVESVKKQRYSSLSVKESYSSTWMIIGYISAFLGGFLGIAIGLSLILMKKKLSNGDKVYVYNEQNRKHGKWITIIGLIVFLSYTIWRIYGN